MPQDLTSLLDRTCDLVARTVDAERIELAKRRHAAVFAEREPDYLPMIFARRVPEIEGLPDFAWGRRFHDPSASLYMQLKEMVLPRIAAGGDYVPGVRADLGTINCQTVLGAEYLVPEDNRTVISRYVPRQRLMEMEVPDDVSSHGVMPRMVEHMEHHLAVLRERGLGDLVSVYHCDQQGPFDIAAMTRGHDIFLDLFEDPPFVHALMGKCTQVYIAVSKLCKRLTGEALNAGNAVGMWMDNGGVRVCGDSDILISADQFRRFVQPYHRRAFAAFGGGWLHYCGGWQGTGRSEGLHLHECYAEIDALRGLNWSTGGDWLGEMRRLRRLGLVHIGSLPRGAAEPLAEYFRRAVSPYERRTGLIFGTVWEGPWLRPGEAEGAMDLWHRIQDEVFA
jgi:hypothetical protein